VDCEFPTDDDASLSEAAEHQVGCKSLLDLPSDLVSMKLFRYPVWRMKHQFAKDIYNSVADATLIAKSPTYSTILDLDRKVREISFPSNFNPYVTKDAGPEIFHSSSLSMRDFYASQHRTVSSVIVFTVPAITAQIAFLF
jgi:hypothetical protein